ncbi:MAG: hypothetical protein FJY85_22215, partial [Deltaproteobacteria bacterium]|nr:hypothetical protein [Deltaproteobacteria bacterium]
MKLQSLALSSAALVLVMALVGSQAWGAVDPPDIILSKVTIYSPQTGQTVQIEGAPGAITNVQVDHTYVKVRNVTRDEAENGGIPRWSSPQRTVNPDGSFTAYSGPDYNCGTGSGDLLALTATNNDWIDPNVVTKDIGYVPNAPDTAPPDLACANSGVTTQSFSSGTLYLGGPGGSIQDTSWPCYVQIVQLDGGPPGLRQTVSGSTDPWSCNCSGLSANELVLLVVSDTYGNRNYRVFEAKSYTYVSGDLPTGSYSYSDQVDAERTG